MSFFYVIIFSVVTEYGYISFPFLKYEWIFTFIKDLLLGREENFYSAVF